MVSSHPLATAAGHEILEAGGSVVDAAVAAAAVLTVVDPRSTGIGGDLFAMIWPKDGSEPVGLNAAGCAPAGMTVENLRAQGFVTMPQQGPWSVTVPGAVGGWRALLARFGEMGVDGVLAPAVRIASDGFRVTPVVGREWVKNAEKLRQDKAANEAFLSHGQPPAIGMHWANPDYARLLERLSREGLESFYRGDIAERIAGAVQAGGGPLRAEELMSWDGTEWVTPRDVTFGDLTVHELPPPGQGLVALMAIAMYDLHAFTDPVDSAHVAIEALKLAFSEGQSRLGDPCVVDVPIDELLASNAVQELAARIDMQQARETHIGPPSDTVYLAVVDADRGACSLIQSVYEGFGSGVGVPGLGMMLHNRGGCFELQEGHPNAPLPGKRSYHTIIPAMLSKEGVYHGCLGVVGGFMQPQGHLQVLRNVIEHGMAPQEAVDAPRFRALSGNHVGFEAGFDQDIVAGLAQRGHKVVGLDPDEAGGAQLILRTADGFLGGSDRRKDGHATFE